MLAVTIKSSSPRWSLIAQHKLASDQIEVLKIPPFARTLHCRSIVRWGLHDNLASMNGYLAQELFKRNPVQSSCRFP